jgi:hypothetical protein
MQDQSVEDKGIVTLPYKWRDEEGELDLTDPTDLEKAKRLINQGYGYEKGQSELKTVKGELEKERADLEYWNGLILEAEKTGDNTKVIAALEMSGLKWDKENDDETLDEGNKEIKEMKNKINSLEAKLTEAESRQYNAFVSDAHTQLEAKYSDGKYPEYNRTEVEDFANKKGIRDFEDAYKLKYYDELHKVESKNDKDKDKKHRNKIKIVASKEAGSGEIPTKPIEVHTNYGKATQKWLGNAEITEGLFIDE